MRTKSIEESEEENPDLNMKNIDYTKGQVLPLSLVPGDFECQDLKNCREC